MSAGGATRYAMPDERYMRHERRHTPDVYAMLRTLRL